MYHKKWPPCIFKCSLCASLSDQYRLGIWLTVFAIWALVSIGTSINRYRLRDKEAAFRADCDADGGLIVSLDERLPGWGFGRFECRIDEDGAKETRSYETSGGRVVVWH